MPRSRRANSSSSDARTAVSAITLHRLAGWAGIAGALLILFAAARRGGLVPENTLTHALAPPASALTLFTLTAFYLYQRDRIGRAGLVGYVLNLLGLAGPFAIEFVSHAVFPYLTEETIDHLLDGPTRSWFLVVAVTFLAGVLTFGMASLRARVFPVAPLLLYVVGFAPASLRGGGARGGLPGLSVGAVGVLWLSAALVRLAARG